MPEDQHGKVIDFHKKRQTLVKGATQRDQGKNKTPRAVGKPNKLFMYLQFALFLGLLGYMLKSCRM